MQDELQILLEREKIIETINGLFIGTDQRDWVWVKRCFAPQGHFDMTSLTGGEPATRAPMSIAERNFQEGVLLRFKMENR